MNRFKKKFEQADQAFDGLHKEAFRQLLGLSQADIVSSTPDTTAVKEYAKLIEVVKEASRKNDSQAKLVENIKALGDVAVSLAKKIPALASLL